MYGLVRKGIGPSSLMTPIPEIDDPKEKTKLQSVEGGMGDQKNTFLLTKLRAQNSKL